MVRLRAPASLPLVAVCVAAAAATLLIPAAPHYDPWNWIIWGREVVDGDLRTAGGISWKPLPVFFTAPLSVFGDAAPDLWLIVARAAAFAAVIPAVALGARLAGALGGALAGGMLLISADLWQPILGGGSEGAAILCVLAAVERGVAARIGQAFAWGIGAALLRPEAWPFLGLYAIWLAAREPNRLRWIVPGLALVPVLWLLPELWGSGSLWRGAERAQQHLEDRPALADQPALTVIENAVELLPAVVLLGLFTAVPAAFGRAVAPKARAVAIGLAALASAWVLLVAVMTEIGFSGNIRYLFPALGIAHVLAGVGFAWAVGALAKPGPRRSLRAALAGALMVLGLYGVARVVTLGWPDVIDDAVRQGRVLDDLDNAIAAAGGERRLTECAPLYATNLLTPAVAWTFERHLEDVTRYAYPPGVVLRAELVEGQPVDPPLDALATAENRHLLALTRYWSVEAACVD